jgi:hypothetical protein
MSPLREGVPIGVGSGSAWTACANPANSAGGFATILGATDASDGTSGKGASLAADGVCPDV